MGGLEKGAAKGKMTGRKRSQDTLTTNKGESNSSDPRFASATWDPRFSRVPKKAKKAIDDERFQKHLKSNPAFRSSSAPVDRFGRPKRKGPQLDKSLQEIAERSDDSLSSESEGEITAVVRELPQRPEYQDSSDGSDMDEELFPEGEEEVEDIPRGKATRRLAVVGLDWSSTRAVDIFASLGSFCPPGKRIESVEVHPSKFGLERLAVEAKLGPQVVPKSDLEVVEQAMKQKLVPNGEKDKDKTEHDDLASDDDDEDSDRDSNLSEEEGEDDEQLWKSQAALRKYEEERLKYYYAVVQFEDVKSADAVYEQCDGVDYAQSGHAFDLRFIPDEMVIETPPRDRADKLPEGYAPPNVTPSSLNNSQVKLSWDADDPDRVVLKKKAVGKHELDEENLKAYLAGSSSEEENEKPSADDLEKKRRLLLGAVEEEKGAEEEGDMDMEVTFEPGMLEKGEEIVKRKIERDQHKIETPWEARLRRLDERKAEKRRKRKQALASGNEGKEMGKDADEDEMGDAVDNPEFESDPFFSVDRDFGEADESRQNLSKKKNDKKHKNKKTQGTSPGEQAETDDAAAKRREAELELLTMKGKRSPGGNGLSMSEMLAAAESDEEEERGSRRKQTRGRRRKQREESAKAEKDGTGHSAMDTNDERFRQVFESHLYAMDPTHPKFKRDETTKRILAEKMRRSAKTPNPSIDGKERGTQAEKKKTGGAEQSEAMQLVASIKAKAAAKRKARRKLN